jgi:hypothetical protein
LAGNLQFNAPTVISVIQTKFVVEQTAVILATHATMLYSATIPPALLVVYPPYSLLEVVLSLMMRPDMLIDTNNVWNRLL